jgi:hypothetical protein
MFLTHSIAFLNGFEAGEFLSGKIFIDKLLVMVPILVMFIQHSLDLAIHIVIFTI